MNVGRIVRGVSWGIVALYQVGLLVAMALAPVSNSELYDVTALLLLRLTTGVLVFLFALAIERAFKR